MQWWNVEYEFLCCTLYSESFPFDYYYYFPHCSFRSIRELHRGERGDSRYPIASHMRHGTRFPSAFLFTTSSYVHLQRLSRTHKLRATIPSSDTIILILLCNKNGVQFLSPSYGWPGWRLLFSLHSTQQL